LVEDTTYLVSLTLYVPRQKKELVLFFQLGAYSELATFTVPALLGARSSATADATLTSVTITTTS